MNKTRMFHGPPMSDPIDPISDDIDGAGAHDGIAKDTD